MRAYYNEIDPYAAQWIRNLIKAGHVTDGEVDERSIVDVVPSDLRGFDRCHFFAGIAVWDYALGLAGWGDTPVWTGSCPCQPFSAAGKGGGFDDERHLWPAWHHLIRECRPATVLGEQVASKDGLGWLDLVQADLEGEGYAVGAADLCAAGVGVEWGETESDEWLQRAILDCPDPILAGELRDYAEWARGSLRVGPAHIRQRLWFVADAGRSGRLGRADAERPARQVPSKRVEGASNTERCGVLGLLGDAGSEGRGQVGSDGRGRREGSGAQGLAERPLHERACSYWSDADWIACRDGKARPVEPGTFPLAHGASARVGRLRAYGNAVNAEAAACFIGAVMDGR